MPEPVAAMLSAMPVAWALPLSVFAFVALLGIVWAIPRGTVLRGAPDGARWRDLRLWATVLVCVQVGVYLAIG
ncbi:MAG: hypothetical protein V2J24_18530 [Pseudomonadales bacterium]|jgi:hypothetical protein|nr:hypothetical protein [Pseudomonadales bacterium]